MNNYEAKKKIVEKGESKIFKNWNEFAGVTKEDFLSALEWVCEDPLTPDGRLTRQIGCEIESHRVVKLNVVYELDGICAFYEVESGKLWGGSGRLKNGMSAGKIAFSCRDRV